MILIKKIYKKNLPEKLRINIRFLIKKINSVSYRGNQVKCNCCNKEFREFGSYGDREVKRVNAVCPWCSSLERTRVLWWYLSGSNLLNNQNKILHIAPERAIEKKLQKNNSIEYLSADLNPNLAMVKMDITNIQYNDDSFDLILCSHVISVVKQDKKALTEFLRVLKKDGVLILQEHIYTQYKETFEVFSADSDAERYKLYGAPYLQRCYGHDFENRLKDLGFKVKVINPAENLSPSEIHKFGFQNSGLLFICNK